MNRVSFSVLLIGAATMAGVPASSNIDAAHRFTWGENMGWVSWRGDTPNPGDGVFVALDHLGGFAWAENVGWINLGNGGGPYANDVNDSATFGVNVDPQTGDLSGMAWGENIGWVDFDTTAFGADRANYSVCDRSFSGFAWAENVGWINLSDAAHFLAVGPCESGDLDCDGTIRLDDYAGFANWFDGPGAVTTCSLFDADNDGDIDLMDFAKVQLALVASP